MQNYKKKTFNIYRYYREEGKPRKLMARNLSWKKAQEWVEDPKTSKTGEWFDGFSEN